MSYKIIVDSCCELPEEFKAEVDCQFIPLGIEVGDHSIMDDDTFDQSDFLKRVATCPDVPKSHCPSPERFMEAMMSDADRVYVITLSGQLSGSYNSAVLGANLYKEEFGEKNIHVFDSRSASCGEAQIAFWIRDLEREGKSFEEIVNIVEKKTDTRKTFFVLDSLEALRKNGRLSNIKAFVANTLNIKPILAGTIEGTIVQMGQARGIDKALSKMIDLTLKDIKTEERTLMIAHCNCRERAERTLKEYLEKAKFANTLIIDTRGISSLYASDGGIIVTM